MSGDGDRRWDITLYSNPQLLSLLGQGWTYASLLRVNTLSSRRIQLRVRPTDTVLCIKQRMEDTEGIAVSAQELRKVNMDGATERTLDDNSTLHESGVVNGTTLFWISHSDGDIALFATNNADGCRMASSAGSETIVLAAEDGKGEEDSKWWEKHGTASGVLAGSGRLRATASVTAPLNGGVGLAGTTASVNSEIGSADGQAAKADRAKAALAAEARFATERATAASRSGEKSEGNAQPWIVVGRRVSIRGLKNEKSAHLNGLSATIVGHLVELDRYLLALDGGQGQVKIKRANCVAIALPKKATKQQVAARKPRVTGGGTAVDAAAMQEELMQEAREARRQQRLRGRTGHEHESVASLLGGGTVEPIDAEALMRAMRHEMGR